jgi:hypothetical protein
MTTVEISVGHLKREDKEANTFLGSVRPKIEESARKLLTLKPNIKLGLGINADFVKVNGNAEEADSQINNIIMTKHTSITSKSQVVRVVDSLITNLLNALEHTKHKGSGYAVKKIQQVFLKSYSVNPIRGSSWIPTPEKFANSRCGLVNIKNEDNDCFKWCMKYHQAKKKRMMTEYQF